MPRPKTLRPRPVEEGDEKILQQLLTNASGYTGRVEREINLLEEFHRRNPHLDHLGCLELFAAQWIAEGGAASSLTSMLENFKSFGVLCGELDLARARVRRARLHNAVKRLAISTDRRFIRKLSDDGLPGIPSDMPEDTAEAERLAFWALICCSGGRPANVLRARSVRVADDGITIGWGLRKVRSNTNAKYAYEWSAPAPAWVEQRWQELQVTPWAFPRPETIASSVNSWLHKWRLDLTSSSPRERLDRVLRTLVINNAMSIDQYVDAIDHTWSMGKAHYDHGGPAG